MPNSVEYDENSKYNPEKTLGTFELTKAAAGFYHQELFKHPEARQYLQNRGITQETIEKYQIGFAPNNWDFIFKSLCADSRQNPDKVSKLLDIGLIKENESGRYYDMFRNRVIIPIRDKKGNVTFKANIKEAYKDPRVDAFKQVVVGGEYQGHVTMVEHKDFDKPSGAFVLLDDYGVEVKCNYPKKVLPEIGDRVDVAIRTKNPDQLRFWGDIVHVDRQD